MSRALDQDAAASIRGDNSQDAYNDIVEALHSSTTELLDIEFLGRTYSLPPGCNVLRDGAGIGIPKLKLVQAFCVARKIFFQCLKDFREEEFQEIRHATAVILLMDPEHITAANARKKIIRQLCASSEAGPESVLKEELLIIDSLLTSRLYRHSKSPTLWGHRRWLLELLNSLELYLNVQQDMETVVLVAAERHSRNYYAWLHLRWLLQSSQGQSRGSELPPFDHSSVLSVVKNWCLRHPADTSAWSFLLFYLLHIELPSTRLRTSSSICREVLGLANSFKWTHESVWVFLRTLVASGEIQEDQRSLFFETLEVVLSAQSDDSGVLRALKASHIWCINYSV